MVSGPEQLPSYIQFLAEHIPILGLALAKGQETLGDKGLRFLVNGSAAVLLVAIFSWAFYIHGHVISNQNELENLEEVTNQIEENNKQLSNIEAQLQSINDHLSNRYSYDE